MNNLAPFKEDKVPVFFGVGMITFTIVPNKVEGNVDLTVTSASIRVLPISLTEEITLKGR
jgi:hypothetical protein